MFDNFFRVVLKFCAIQNYFSELFFSMIIQSFLSYITGIFVLWRFEKSWGNITLFWLQNTFINVWMDKHAFFSIVVKMFSNKIHIGKHEKTPCLVIVKEDQRIHTHYKLLLLPCLVTQSLTVGLYCWGQHILNIRFGGIQLECPSRGPVLILFKGVMQTIKVENQWTYPTVILVNHKMQHGKIPLWYSIGSVILMEPTAV